MLNWWTHRDSAAGIAVNMAYSSVQRQADTNQPSFLQGHYDMPLDGRWLVKFDFFVPKYDKAAHPESIFPSEAIGAVSNEDVIEVYINGVKKTLQTNSDLAGHKQAIEFEVEGQVLEYRFDFLSPTVPTYTHPFITAAEISLVRDRNPSPAMGNVKARVRGLCIDAVDGRKLKENSKVSNGYKKKAWKVETDPTLSIFKGSTLILSKTMPKGKIRERFPVGKFSCMIKHINFYTVFVPDCDIEAREGLELGDIAMSPVLNPGDSRIVLNWGSRPKDLDSYLTVPHSDPAKPDCVINYKNKVRVIVIVRLVLRVLLGVEMRGCGIRNESWSSS